MMPNQITKVSSQCSDERVMRDAQFAMRLSLIFGVAMLVGKSVAYFMTHSAAIFSDAAESVIHVIAVGFASGWMRSAPS
jgi:divalent metal cation (Fe/Co/Zn/Cd) transporter